MDEVFELVMGLVSLLAAVLDLSVVVVVGIARLLGIGWLVG